MRNLYIRSAYVESDVMNVMYVDLPLVIAVGGPCIVYLTVCACIMFSFRSSVFVLASGVATRGH